MKLSFKEKVHNIVKAIPKGTTMTYKRVATKAGSPGGARAVGTIMKGNYDVTIPCHRVIRSDGTIGEYNRGGPEAKEKLLIKEKAL